LKRNHLKAVKAPLHEALCMRKIIGLDNIQPVQCLVDRHL